MEHCIRCGIEYEPGIRNSGMCQSCRKYFGDAIRKAKGLSMWHHHEPAQEIYNRLLLEAPTLMLTLGIAQAMSMDRNCFCGKSPRQLQFNLEEVGYMEVDIRYLEAQAVMLDILNAKPFWRNIAQSIRDHWQYEKVLKSFIRRMDMELYGHTGEPTEEEIQQRLEFWQSWSPNGYKDNHLRITKACPMCESPDDTEWVRNEWYICYNCMIAFTLQDSIGYYDVEAYQQDVRIEQEILEEVDEYGI